MKNLKVFVMLIALCACDASKNKVDENELNSNPSKKEQLQSTSQVSSSDQNVKKIVNNEFAYKPFGIKIDDENIVNVVGNLNKEIKLVNNQHTNSVDTVFLFTLDKSHLKIYKGDGLSFLQEASIESDNLTLSGNVKVGMEKTDFLKVFGFDTSIIEDLIVVTDDEEYAEHTFYFSEGILVKIELRPGYD